MNETYSIGGMTITETKITIRDLVKDYEDKEEEGVSGYSGKLDIRPAYQREFIYNDAERKAVINTVRLGFPLNIMYWAKCESGDFEYEVLDGQQRTISICQYVNNDFSIVKGNDDPNPYLFSNLSPTEQKQILDYPLTVYICEGSQEAKLAWFRVINVAGEVLKPQELRNAIYTGTWLTDAKRHFSKKNAPAVGLSDKYMTGTSNRQDYLAQALSWIADRDKDVPKIKEATDKISAYMAIHQDDEQADDLWDYFKDVIGWAKKLFPKTYKDMKTVKWGLLYNKYHENDYDVKELTKQVEELYGDREVTDKSGIFEYVLGGKESLLSIREFEDEDKRAKYKEQAGICPMCKEHYEYEAMQGDHRTPWSKGGKTVYDNLQMLCEGCNKLKSATEIKFRRFN